MGLDLLHLGFLVTVFQQLAFSAEPCEDPFPTQQHVQAGENVSMSCNFTVYDPRTAPTVQWNYWSQTNNMESINLYTSINGNENRFYYRPHFEGRTWVNATGLAHGDATLHLAGVTTSDQGYFSCFVGQRVDCTFVAVQLWVSDHQQFRSALACGLAATCFPGLVLSLAAAVTLCM